jgi:hypothetical protein
LSSRDFLIEGRSAGLFLFLFSWLAAFDTALQALLLKQLFFWLELLGYIEALSVGRSKKPSCHLRCHRDGRLFCLPLAACFA